MEDNTRLTEVGSRLCGIRNNTVDKSTTINWDTRTADLWGYGDIANKDLLIYHFAQHPPAQNANQILFWSREDPARQRIYQPAVHANIAERVFQSVHLPEIERIVSETNLVHRLAEHDIAASVGTNPQMLAQKIAEHYYVQRVAGACIRKDSYDGPIGKPHDPHKIVASTIKTIKSCELVDW